MTGRRDDAARIDASLRPDAEPGARPVPAVLNRLRQHAKALDPSSRHPVIPSSRQFVRSAAMVLGAVMLMRAALVEPFGVSTGSMAPTLIGVHRAGLCPRCGFPVSVGAPSEGASVTRHYAAASCPNCGQSDLGLE